VYAEGEEWLTRPTRTAGGGARFGDARFVVLNMVGHAAFIVAGLLVVTRGRRLLLMPVLLFVVYGAISNAVAHTWWSLSLRAYFPGLVTAQVFRVGERGRCGGGEPSEVDDE
jgi:hypothetical protein